MTLEARCEAGGDRMYNKSWKTEVVSISVSNFQSLAGSDCPVASTSWLESFIERRKKQKN